MGTREGAAKCLRAYVDDRWGGVGWGVGVVPLLAAVTSVSLPAGPGPATAAGILSRGDNVTWATLS